MMATSNHHALYTEHLSVSKIIFLISTPEVPPTTHADKLIKVILPTVIGVCACAILITVTVILALYWKFKIKLVRERYSNRIIMRVFM